MLLHPRLTLAMSLALLATIPSPAEAAAPSVYVRHEGAREVDPVAIGFADANHSASSNLATGSFRALATTPAAQAVSSTGAGIEANLTFTNNNPFPFTIWEGSLGANFAGSYSVVPPGPSIDTGADSNIFLAVLTTGPPATNYSVSLDHALRANGIPANDVNQVSPETSGGASFLVTAASFTSFIAEVWMPTFTLQPGETMIVAFQIDAFAQRNSSANFFNPGGAQLFFDLPAGISLTTNATTPLDWVVVPEAGDPAMLVTGVAALLALAKRRNLLAR